MNEENLIARRLARRFRLVNWLWIGISLLQLASLAGIVAAAWNLYVTIGRWRVPSLMENRSPAVVRMYQGDGGWFITFLVINLALGGVIGAALIAYEYVFIRATVLKNRHVFGASSSSAYHRA